MPFNPYLTQFLLLLLDMHIDRPQPSLLGHSVCMKAQSWQYRTVATAYAWLKCKSCKEWSLPKAWQCTYLMHSSSRGAPNLLGEIKGPLIPLATDACSCCSLTSTERTRVPTAARRRCERRSYEKKPLHSSPLLCTHCHLMRAFCRQT